MQLSPQEAFNIELFRPQKVDAALHTHSTLEIAEDFLSELSQIQWACSCAMFWAAQCY